MKKNLIYTLIILLALGSSCVPARKFEDLQERHRTAEAENRQLKEKTETLSSENEELKDRLARLEKAREDLTGDTTRYGRQLRMINEHYEQLNDSYMTLMGQKEKLLEGKSIETQQILARLQETQEDLQRREDQLRAASRQMDEKEQNLNRLMAEISDKEVRLNELEDILSRQDSVVNALRNTVSNALLGFQDNGLSVEIKNGKVYVSLEESLLFATGSTRVDSRGESALKELAAVLEKNPDINVLIEGHTDDVPFRPGSQIQDNWDLSVLRATAIVRILKKHGSNIDPQRLVAAGRGEYHPLDPDKTPEARAKNRRTEIILTPQLDELFQIIETN